ncbi:MAG: hypothetical protein ACXVEF_31420 [Polyangiales bacterium]
MMNAEEIAQMQAKAIDGLKEARTTVEAFARENPRTAIAIAVGVGFVLGGGITPRILLGLGALAARTVGREYLKDQLKSKLSGQVGSILGKEPERASMS